MTAFPTVARDENSAAFFDAAARGELLVQRCSGCATTLAPETRTCHACGGAVLQPTTASGLGRLITWAVVTQAPMPMLADAVPYVTAAVELDEGPWLMVRLIDADTTALASGRRVRVDFVRAGELLPVFRPITEENA